MTRVKRGTISMKRRRNVLAQVKGYRYGRGSKERQAREAISHAGNHSFAHRKDKKNVFRRLWQIKINAAVRPFELSYSKFIGNLKKNKIGIDRKILADLAQNNPDVFEKIITKAKI